jgi:hypothetical protein
MCRKQIRINLSIAWGLNSRLLNFYNLELYIYFHGKNQISNSIFAENVISGIEFYFYIFFKNGI